MKTVVITKDVPSDINKLITINPEDFVISVDGALADVLKQKIKVDLAIGDFDSLTSKGLLKGHDTIHLNTEKDVTDTFYAIEKAYELFDNEVFLLGGVRGDRIEHFMANVLMLDKFPKLTIMDDFSTIYLIEEGDHLISKSNYISFFGFPDAVVTLKGFKYNLDKYKLKPYDALGISNETIKSYGEVKVHQGRVIVVKATKK